DAEQPCAFLGVGVKHFVKVPEAEQQQCIRRHLLAVLAVLLHHRGFLCGAFLLGHSYPPLHCKGSACRQSKFWQKALFWPLLLGSVSFFAGDCPAGLASVSLFSLAAERTACAGVAGDQSGW